EITRVDAVLLVRAAESGRDDRLACLPLPAVDLHQRVPCGGGVCCLGNGELCKWELALVQEEVRVVVPREEMHLLRVPSLQLTESVRGDGAHVPLKLAVDRLVHGLLGRDSDLNVDLVQVPARTVC